MLLSLSLVAVGSFADPPASVSLTIRFDGSTVVASGAKPGATVLFYGIGPERHRYWTTEVVRQRIVADRANSGTVTADLGAPVLPRSVWVVIDLTTGRSAMAAPAGAAVHQTTIPPGHLKPGEDGELSRLDLKAAEMDILWSRPGTGVWKVAIADGGPFDADGQNDGHVVASIEAMKPVGNSPPTPKHFLPGDVLFAINPVTLEVEVVEVGK